MNVIPSGASTYSKARYHPSAPKRAVTCSGQWVTCDDGWTYVDAVAALGPIILGHDWTSVTDAVTRQMCRGVSFSLPTDIEHRLAERLVGLVPGMDMCLFGKNGNDVVNAAVRVARAVKGTENGNGVILREEGAYHGHADWAITGPMDAGVHEEASAEYTWPVVRGDLADIDNALQSDVVAAVILDPCPAHDPTIQPPEYFQEIRKLCDEHGALLIWDEMVTGFRMGWPKDLPVEGDLWCGAKALGNGWPITALVGKREYMERIEQDVFYSTTFAGEAVSIAAALACLDEMERLNVPKLLAEMGTELTEWYTREAEARGLGASTHIIGYPARPVFRWTRPDLNAAFTEGVIRGGMLFQGYVNLMVAHREAWPEILAALTDGLDAADVVLGARLETVP